MDATGKQLLDLMFRPGESICVSHNKYGFHSIPLEEAKSDLVILVPTPESAEKRKLTLEEATEAVDTSALLLCALNPINGYRTDVNCTHFRNFLVEMDTGELKAQKDYVDYMEMPYSACVFSGGKSLHFLISLSFDIKTEKDWRMLCRWTLSIMTLADQKTLNPSRSIRIPGALRKGNLQKLLVMNGPVKMEDFVAWLEKHPSAKPEVREARVKSLEGDFSRIKPWAEKIVLVDKAIDPTKGRNQQWFGLACEFAIAGYSEDETINFLRQIYVEEHDFKEREWLTTIRSGFKTVDEGKIGK